MIVIGIETSTPQTSVAIGSERGILAQASVAGRARQESAAPALERLLAWSATERSQIGGVAVGIGPGLFTGLRVGVETAKAFAQALRVPIIGLGSLDVLAYAVGFTRRTIAAVIDGRRGEVFYALYRPVPGGVVRTGEPAVGAPDHLVADLEALEGDVLVVGDGAILYHDEIAELGARVAFASHLAAHPAAGAVVELAVPRFLREEHDRLYDVAPFYLRRSDAEIAWDERHRGAPA